jgi:membrane protein required for colicin V production
MQGADYIIVAVVGISVILGVVRGFVREAVALLSWLVGIWVAWRFSGFLHPYLGGALESPEQKAWAARVIVLVLVLLAGALVGAILSWVTNTAAGLSLVDRVLGFVFGLTRGAVLVGVGVMIGHALDLDGESWWKRAQLMPYAEYVGNWLEDYAGQTRELAKRALNADARFATADYGTEAS